MKDDTLHAVARKSLRRRTNRRQFSIEIEKIDTSQATQQAGVRFGHFPIRIYL